MAFTSDTFNNANSPFEGFIYTTDETIEIVEAEGYFPVSFLKNQAPSSPVPIFIQASDVNRAYFLIQEKDEAGEIIAYTLTKFS